MLNAAADEFPALDSIPWIHYVHVNERKFGATNATAFGPTLRAIVEALNAPPFLEWLRRLTGLADLFPDDSLEGGGLHQSARGGFLNIHADFTVHPHHADWRRRVNVLLYLNRNWKEEYGGHLELWDAGMKACVRKVLPVFNRAVIFSTDHDSFHGHPEPLACPDTMTRKSIALYYFTKGPGPVFVRSTEYRPRPGEGLGALWIRLDNLALRAYDRAKRMLGIDDRFASMMLRTMSRILGRHGRDG